MRFPNGQLLSVVHVKGDQKQNVRCPHAGDVQSSPIAPASPSSLAAEIRCRKRQRAKNEQVKAGVPQQEPARKAAWPYFRRTASLISVISTSSTANIR